jgi:hypothetical protein
MRPVERIEDIDDEVLAQQKRRLAEGSHYDLSEIVYVAYAE